MLVISSISFVEMIVQSIAVAVSIVTRNVEKMYVFMSILLEKKTSSYARTPR